MIEFQSLREKHE